MHSRFGVGCIRGSGLGAFAFRGLVRPKVGIVNAPRPACQFVRSRLQKFLGAKTIPAHGGGRLAPAASWCSSDAAGNQFFAPRRLGANVKIGGVGCQHSGGPHARFGNRRRFFVFAGWECGVRAGPPCDLRKFRGAHIASKTCMSLCLLVRFSLGCAAVFERDRRGDPPLENESVAPRCPAPHCPARHFNFRKKCGALFRKLKWRAGGRDSEFSGFQKTEGRTAGFLLAFVAASNSSVGPAFGPFLVGPFSPPARLLTKHTEAAACAVGAKCQHASQKPFLTMQNSKPDARVPNIGCPSSPGRRKKSKQGCIRTAPRCSRAQTPGRLWPQSRLGPVSK